MYVILLMIVSFGLYVNTFYNDYCLDDAIVITENNTTKEGFAGIADHFRHDYLYGYLNRSGNSAFTPWRPLTLTTFSFEIGLWGEGHPGYSHVINVLLFSLLILIIYNFLRAHIFKNEHLAFFTALLFAIHPAHSEVVANIKSRDELLCMIFVLTSMFYLLKYSQKRERGLWLVSLLFFWLALLSKETAFTFIAGVPLILFFFSTLQRKKIILLSSYFILVAVIFLLTRAMALSGDREVSAELDGSMVILNYPFLYATVQQAVFTKIMILGKYLLLLLWPAQLCYDYSYNQIPYVGADNIWAWFSILIHLALGAYALITIRKRSFLSFCILMYAITFSISSNLVIEIAATIGERLIFIPSLFFCMALVYVLYKGIQYAERKGLNSKWVAPACILPVVLLCSFRVIDRNGDWKNTDTLNLADYPKAPNSIRINNAMGNYYLQRAYDSLTPGRQADSLVKKAIPHYKKALTLFPEFKEALINIGVCYDKLGDMNTAENYWNQLRRVSPDNNKLLEFDNYLSDQYLRKGILTNINQNFDSSEIYLQKSIQYSRADTLRAKGYFHLAGAYYAEKKYKKAYDALGQVLVLQPENNAARMGYENCKNLLLSTGQQP